MSSPLERLLQGVGIPIAAETLDGFLAARGPAVLLFTGDPAQRAEAQDAAVVATQLARQVWGLRVGVVDAAAEAVKLRYGVVVVPTLVFLQDGRVQSTISKLQPWAVYAEAAKGLSVTCLEALS